jgi:hypothetical protein
LRRMPQTTGLMGEGNGWNDMSGSERPAASAAGHCIA